MFGRVSEEMEVKVAASKAWELYGTLQFAKIVQQNLPPFIDKIELLEGDGGVGTVFKVSFPSGSPPTWYKEKYTKVDNETRVKELEMTEGGFLDLGFILYRIRFEIMAKEEDSCIIRVTVEYEVKEEAAANASLVSLESLLVIMNIAAKYLLSDNTSSSKVTAH